MYYIKYEYENTGVLPNEEFCIAKSKDLSQISELYSDVLKLAELINFYPNSSCRFILISDKKVRELRNVGLTLDEREDLLNDFLFLKRGEYGKVEFA